MRGRHIILIGPPGAGKTAVGRGLAARLGIPFVDLDEWIEAREGRTVAQIFEESGEAYFRRLEQKLTAEVVDTDAIVLAPGGGWAAQPAAVAALRPFASVVYLRVSPERAVERMREGIASRPLLAGGDPVAAVTALLERRRAAYEAAHFVVDTELLEIQEVIEAVAAIASSPAGEYD